MALNITFVDEVGTNLNRYRVVDTSTNEVAVVDLERAGTITTNGTKITAELMNKIIAEINKKSVITITTNSDGTASLVIS